MAQCGHTADFLVPLPAGDSVAESLSCRSGFYAAMRTFERAERLSRTYLSRGKPAPTAQTHTFHYKKRKEHKGFGGARGPMMSPRFAILSSLWFNCCV